MERWFGDSWGAPACEAEAHIRTPIGQSCLYCKEPILEGQQGLIQHVVRVRTEGMAVSEEPIHLDCFLRGVRPHGRECPRCRGKRRSEHAEGCAWLDTGFCSCTPMPEGG